MELPGDPNTGHSTFVEVKFVGDCRRNIRNPALVARCRGFSRLCRRSSRRECDDTVRINLRDNRFHTYL